MRVAICGAGRTGDANAVLFKQRPTTPEAREAFAAFAERRQADFSKLSA